MYQVQLILLNKSPQTVLQTYLKYCRYKSINIKYVQHLRNPIFTCAVFPIQIPSQSVRLDLTASHCLGPDNQTN